MLRQRIILGSVIFLLVGVFCRQLLSQGRSSGGFSGGGVAAQSGESAEDRARRFHMMGPRRMPGQPDTALMKNMSPEQRIQYFQKLAEEQRKAMAEQETLAMKQTLGVTDQQWKSIEPKLKKVKHYKEQAFLGVRPPLQSSFSSFSQGPGGDEAGGGFAGGSFQFQAGGSMSPMGGGGFAPMGEPGRPLTDGERIVEELQWLLHDLQPNPVDVRQKMIELRKAREKAMQQWVRAQEDLRKVLDLRQEATLMMMGLLQ